MIFQKEFYHLRSFLVTLALKLNCHRVQNQSFAMSFRVSYQGIVITFLSEVSLTLMSFLLDSSSFFDTSEAINKLEEESIAI